MFAHRYDAAITSLGVPAEVAYADDGQSLPAPMADLMETMDVLNTTDQDYPVPMAPMEDASHSPGEMAREAAFSGAYDLAESAVVEAPASSPPPPPPSSVIVDALQAIVSDELPQGDWVDQPTMVPILSAGIAAGTGDDDAAGGAPVTAQTPPSVPVLTPPPPQTP